MVPSPDFDKDPFVSERHIYHHVYRSYLCESGLCPVCAHANGLCFQVPLIDETRLTLRWHRRGASCGSPYSLGSITCIGLASVFRHTGTGTGTKFQLPAESLIVAVLLGVDSGCVYLDVSAFQARRRGSRQNIK